MKLQTQKYFNNQRLAPGTDRDVEEFPGGEVLPGEDLARRAVDVELRVLRALQRVGHLGVGTLVQVVGHHPVHTTEGCFVSLFCAPFFSFTSAFRLFIIIINSLINNLFIYLLVYF